jgi:hypothetical protein
MFCSEMKTLKDVKKFFDYLVEVEHVNFHPDEDFKNYISLETKKRVFNAKQIKHYNDLMNKAFLLCTTLNRDIYAIGITNLKNILTT